MVWCGGERKSIISQADTKSDDISLSGKAKKGKIQKKEKRKAKSQLGAMAPKNLAAQARFWNSSIRIDETISCIGNPDPKCYPKLTDHFVGPGADILKILDPDPKKLSQF
uniref:Uncharacterized protein n=1 Tax=Romanomermis culicivorax TaxID=13658 RepID=A0A915JF65_ROMCU